MVRKSQQRSLGETFAESLAETRNAAGLSQRELADRLGAAGLKLDHSKLSKIESGERKVTIDEAFGIAIALDVSPAALLAPRDNSAVAIAPNAVFDGDLVVRWLAGFALPGASFRKDKTGRHVPRWLPTASPDRRLAWWLSQRSDREARANRVEGFPRFFASLDALLSAAGDPDLSDDLLKRDPGGWSAAREELDRKVDATIAALGAMLKALKALEASHEPGKKKGRK